MIAETSIRTQWVDDVVMASGGVLWESVVTSLAEVMGRYGICRPL